MDSYHYVLRGIQPRTDSPAKVFAKLKAKVREESGCGRKGFFTSKKDGAEFNSPRRRSENTWVTGEHKANQKFGSNLNEMQPLTLSPIASPPHAFGYKVHPPVLESTAVSCSLFLTDKGSVFSPMRKRLRKRKWEQQEMNKVCSSAEGSNEDIHEPQQWNACTFAVNDFHNNNGTDDLGYCRGFSGDQLKMMHGHLHPPPRSTAEKRCREGFPMSPAKIFASMKERESKGKMEQAHKVNSSKKDLFGDGNINLPRHTPLSTTQNMCETQDAGFTNALQSPLTSNETDSADSQSKVNRSEDALTSAVPLVLQEDLLVLKTPQVSIPKKYNNAVFKHNKWPKQMEFPSESMIYLKKWFLRKNHKGLFVDGIHGESNIQWNSNIIVDRVSNSVVKTVSGRVYILVGNMKMHYASGFPRWLLKKFAKGFPPNWKELYERLLLETRNNQRSIEPKRNTEQKTRASTNNTSTLKRCRQTSLKTAESCTPNSYSCSRVSRSGRVIKPPLEYWKGGRVVLDADMNVQVFGCYETTICDDVSTMMSFSTVEPPVEKLGNSQKSPSRKTKSRQRCPATVDTVPLKQIKPAKSKNTSDTANRHSVREKRSKSKATNSPESPKAHDKTLQDESSSDAFTLERKRRGKAVPSKKGRKVRNKSTPDMSSSKQSSDESAKRPWKRIIRTPNNNEGQAEKKPSTGTKTSPPAKPLPKSTASKGNVKQHKENQEDEWTEAELMKLQEAVVYYPKHMKGYWAEVARLVGTRSAEECHNKHTSQGMSKTPNKAAKKVKKQKEEAVKAPDNPVISAKVGTFKRKQQVRQFLENMPREDVDDVFSTAYMQSKRFEIPSLCPSDDQDLTVSELEPLTPRSSCFPEVKTPQCLHITPGMMGSPNRDCDDKYVYQLQKRMKKNQFDVCKRSAKSFTPAHSVKQPMRRCNTGNNSFVVWEMFSGNNGASSESGEEEDFYFSDND
ncbi:mis18-binding protein 1 isoform X2 [Parambassis ranga]|uniref:Mis18-binding protein 1 isoform X2 n=1 Tax=Parambassis ranga TaxID=210632 RepID=A0A6P7HHG0_9TELE|nr:mis18-binding protein 1 isoform X2 [Parambassis ranga]